MTARDMRDTAVTFGNVTALSDRLDHLAHRVRRLAPSHRNPESYHFEKSEIEHALRCLARQAKGNRT
jgi:hypothetical protein